MDDYITDMEDPELLEACELSEADLREDDGDLDNSGTFCSRTRNMLFGGFRKGVREAVIEKDNHICQGCEQRVEKGKETIDHCDSVSHWFNAYGYKMSRAERNDWYNNIDNLQLMHRGCNSEKGGEPFNPAHVSYALNH